MIEGTLSPLEKQSVNGRTPVKCHDHRLSQTLSLKTNTQVSQYKDAQRLALTIVNQLFALVLHPATRSVLANQPSVIRKEVDRSSYSL